MLTDVTALRFQLVNNQIINVNLYRKYSIKIINIDEKKGSLLGLNVGELFFPITFFCFGINFFFN